MARRGGGNLPLWHHAVVSPAEPTDSRDGPSGPSTARSKRWGRVLSVVVLVEVMVGAVILILVLHHGQRSDPAASAIRPSGIPASVPTHIANLMQLSALPRKAAPGFRLVDQQARPYSLAAFRGKVVVLEFMDPHCVDICPIVSDEFVIAQHDLGRMASHVVFAAVNVNQFHESTTAVMSFSRAHNLLSIPSWHFFTGATGALKKVWRAYGVEVLAPNPNADIVHSSLVYFIDPKGLERYLASPMVDHTASGHAYLPPSNLQAWGRGIALVAEQLAR